MLDPDVDGDLTTISLSDVPPSQLDRRVQDRQVAILRVAKLRTPHGEERLKDLKRKAFGDDA